MMDFGTGWISGLSATHEGLDAAAAHLAAARDSAAGLPDETAIARAPWIVNQGPRESCTCETGIRWIYAHTGVKTSSWIPWWAARLLDAPHAPLRNVGVSFQAFVQAIQQDGATTLRADEAEQYDPAAVPPGVDRIAAQKTRLDVLEFHARGADHVLAQRYALSKGMPTGAVIHADAGYRSAPGGICAPETDTSAGLHMITLWGYRQRAGAWEFMSPSSYGTLHGVTGIVWIPESRIASSPWGGGSPGLGS